MIEKIPEGRIKIKCLCLIRPLYRFYFSLMPI